jgi:dynamin-binding protein
MEEVAANVNEGKRRWEIVKVLNLNPKTTDSPERHLGAAAQAQMRNARPVKANKEVLQVEMMEIELRRAVAFVQEFAKASVKRSKAVGSMVMHLQQWALGFAKLLGLSEEDNSEAFDAFLTVVQQQLVPLCLRLHDVVAY